MSLNADCESDTTGYLIGLMLGRGTIFRSQQRVRIEFPHKNPTISGIAHCAHCGWLATGQKSLRCKNPKCRREVSGDVRIKYEQQRDTVSSVNDVIVPFIRSGVQCTTKVGVGTFSTHLIVDFKEAGADWRSITSLLPVGTSHHDFRIPDSIPSWTRDVKKEFVNGLLDTAGFANAGSWLPRDGVNGHGRMRLYFQIVKNWRFVVEIDNFLRREFSIPIQTIDWGHPNIRSGAGNESDSSAATREHQVKIFPEYMTEFCFRVSSKQKMFQELLEHNIQVDFTQREDWFPPSKLRESEIRPAHRAENDIRLPSAVRRHFDKSWQVSLALGCEFMAHRASTAKNPTSFALTGDLECVEPADGIRRRFYRISVDRQREIEARRVSAPAVPTAPRDTPEFRTYEPLRAWLEGYLRQRFDSGSAAWITAEQNLGNFLNGLDHEVINQLDDLEDLRIRPDIVGFLPSEKEFVFLESKVTSLGISEVGQLMGYCLVAVPKLALLVSTVPIDEALKQLVENSPDLVSYGGDFPLQMLHFEPDSSTAPKGFQNAI